MKIIVIAACAWALAAAAQAAPPSPADEAALRTLAASVDEAWDLKDAVLITSYYTADATLLVEGTDGAQQGQALEAYFQRSFAGRAGVLRHVSEVQALDTVGPDAALADLEIRIEAQQPDGRWKELRRFNNLSLAIREGGAWKLRAVRARPRPRQVAQSSTCSEIESASSTSMPKYRTVLSSLRWPRSS